MQNFPDMVGPPELSVDRHALFLDFDGTLVDFAPEPDAIIVPPFLPPRLIDLEGQLDGALALVSGRRIDSLDHHLGLSLAAGGQHGHELRFPGRDIETRSISPELDIARMQLAEQIDATDRLFVEDKGAALVIHYRSAPEMAQHAKDIARNAAGGLSDLQIVHGHAIVEIRPLDEGKAGAVMAFMTLPPFAGRQPVFVGDDRTDEDGFSAVQTAGGFGIKVGTGDTIARYRLAGVSDVYDWLGVQLA